MPRVRKLKAAKGNRLSANLCRLLNKSHRGNLTSAAEQIGCDYDVLYRAATGRARSPNYDDLAQIAAYYGFSIDRLLTGRLP
jgi:hypothetical protein